jgi:lysophospholipid acyltransferase (LPLAT)-like uncharacterized protein
VIKKILKSNIIINALSYIFLGYLCLTYHTCRKQFIASDIARNIMEGTTPAIFPCWHSRFSMYLAIRRFGSFQAITSAHKDGNFLENILRFFNHTPIRGSSRKKAFSAAKSVLSIDPEKIRLVVTPDGPLGPRYKVKGLIIKMAERLGVPLVPLTFSASHAIVLGTWDRFIIPIHIHDPIYADQNLSEDLLSSIMYNQMVDLDHITHLKVDY